ncbi:glyoxalase/bleomycin resistance/dioxygenase family protein [Sulfitobacter sp. SK012]|uniref:VOC family protein n=1 Tax=Sulfitobacter sp. SK012 TaxID=1389005 RepID=UPI000E0AFBA2|nr:VOC family protein [Sulfitobacter sp. SK012]AXI47464.1 glyoxalase/bleomycin resistance/dioxygenase family protein [Sulfitobacter sp. SK012]
MSNSSPFASIKRLDYTVLIVRDMAAMQRFYEDVLLLKVTRKLSENWYEYAMGDTILALSNPGLTADDAPVPRGTAAVQLAFQVPRVTVDDCHVGLLALGIDVVSPPTDRDFGHRTLFFRDPDGNLLEIYAEI